MQDRRIDRDPGFDQGALTFIGLEHLAGEGPEVVDGGLQAGVTFRTNAFAR